MIRRALAAVCAVGVAFAALGCDDNAQVAVGEAFTARNAQFMRGKLPGTPPEDPMMADADGGGPDEDLPRITAIGAGSAVVVQGQAGTQYAGRTTKNAVAVAVSFSDDSSGYWVVPIGPLDVATDEPSWSMTADLGVGLEPGFHELRAVAIDEDDVAGPQSVLKVCVRGRVPDNLHACDDSLALPRAVITLTWDANVDLDLQVVDRKGNVIDAKHSVTPDGPGAGGVVDRDSNAACVIDGIRAESLVWNTSVPKGLYGIYVNMFDACKLPAVRFRVEVYSAAAQKGGGEKLHRWYQGDGELLEMSANHGSARGLFVTEFKF